MTPTPQLPTDNFPRVFRGGTWDDTSATCVRSAFRYDLTPTVRDNSIGFRCAQRGCRQILKVTP